MQRRELNLLTIFVVFLSAYHVIARVGLAIDIQWHTDIGRDKLLTPPHMMIFSGIIPTLVFLACYIFWFSFCVQIRPEATISRFSQLQYRFGSFLLAW